MIDDASLFDFSRSCAASYCRRFGASDLDDATQEASLYLLQIRDKWNKPRNYLRKRVVFALVRKYQNEKGLRRKNRIRRIDLDVFLIAEKIKDKTQSEDARRAVDEAIRNAGLEYAREAIELLIDGWTRKEVRQRFGIKFREVSEIWKSFLREFHKLYDLNNSDKDYPLFKFQGGKNNGSDQSN